MSDTEEIQEFTLGEADFTYNLDEETKADVPTLAEHPVKSTFSFKRPIIWSVEF